MSSWRAAFRRAELFLFALSISVLLPALSLVAEAQPRDFKGAAQQIVKDVALGSFGAMVVAITGVLAIVAAVAGSYKGAWAVLYVSVGLYILKDLVNLLFTVA